MDKLSQLLSKQGPRRRRVELTPSGPVLLEGAISSVDAIKSYEVDEATWDDLTERLKTGQLDNATVETIIKAKK